MNVILLLCLMTWSSTWDYFYECFWVVKCV